MISTPAIPGGGVEGELRGGENEEQHFDLDTPKQTIKTRI